MRTEEQADDAGATGSPVSSRLLEAFAAAIERRAGIGWPHTERAALALAAARAEEAGPVEAPLDDAARHFGLSGAETRVLEVAAAAGRSVALHLLTGLLSGDDGPQRPTVALALELAGLPVTDAAAHRHLGPLAAAVRLGLLTAAGEEVLLARRLVLTERVAAHLAGDDLPDPAVLALLEGPVPLDAPGTDLVAAALTAGQRLIWVHGPLGSAGSALAAAACRRLDVPCLVADLHRLAPGADPGSAVTGLFLEAGLTGAVLILRGAERARAEHFEHAALPVIAVSTEAWDPAWADELPPIVTAPRPSLAERARLWQPLLGERAEDREISALRLGPEQIVAVGRHARTMAELHGEEGVSRDRIRAAARQLGRGRGVRSDGGAPASLDDLVLPPHALGEIERLLDWARYRDEVIAMGPLHGKGGKGSGICALFSGPPGTGKTLAAHVIADSLAMDLYQVELSSVVDKYIGETEKNLEKVFDAAESMNAVLFFDEADALFGSRSEVRDARDRYANQEIAYLLQRMEHFDGITVLASNLRGNIDAAFARRLHFIVSFPEPDEATRARLWEHHLAALREPDDGDPVDIAYLARTVELAGGDIRNIVLSAAYACVAAGDALGMRHVAAAVRREYIKLGKRVPNTLVDADHTQVAPSRTSKTARSRA